MRSRFAVWGGVAICGLTMAACSSATRTDLFSGLPNAGLPPGTPAVDSADGGATADAKPKDPGSPTQGDAGAPEDRTDAAPNDPNALLDGRCVRAAVTRAPTYVLVALDGSGSMFSIWANTVAALGGVFDDLGTAADPSFGVGLMVFSDSKDPTNGSGPYPSAKDVSIAPVLQAQHVALRARIDPALEGGGSPTRVALSGAYAALETFLPTAPLPAGGKKVVLFITDGSIPNGGIPEEDQCVTAAADKLLTKGIMTSVIGIGAFPAVTSEYEATFMGRLASAGGVAPTGCNPLETANLQNVCHNWVTPGGKTAVQLKQDFLGALHRAVVSCELGLGGSDPSQLNVVLKDGAGTESVVLQDAVDGWTYDDPTNPSKAVLHGKSCDSLKLDPKASASFLAGCPTFVP